MEQVVALSIHITFETILQDGQIKLLSSLN